MRGEIVCLMLAAVAASGQETPTFRAGSRLVDVDVVVHGKNGPERGLTKEDFTLLDNGKPRAIALFSVTEAGGARKPAVPLPAGTVSNRATSSGGAPEAATVLLIDRLNTPVTSQPYANQKVLEFLQSRENVGRLGIYMLGNTVRVIQDLSDDPERLGRAARNLKPQDVRRMSSQIDTGASSDAVTDQMRANEIAELQDFVVKDKVATTREALEAIARHLASVPGRKNLIWVSGSFPLFIKRPHYTIDFSEDVDEAARVLDEANVAVYAVDARGLMGMTANSADQSGSSDSVRNCATQKGPCILPGPGIGNLPSGLDTMNFLTHLTGGRSYYNTNGIDDSIRAAIDDGQVTYTLGFYPPSEALDDRFHKLGVKVSRRGVEVRLRSGYFASSNAAQAAPPTMQQLLSDSLDATAIGLSVQARPAGIGIFEVAATLDLHDIRLERQDGKWIGNVELVFWLEAAHSGQNVDYKIAIPESDLASALEKGVTITGKVEGSSGMLRVVAQDRATGAAGSVHVALPGR